MRKITLCKPHRIDMNNLGEYSDRVYVFDGTYEELFDSKEKDAHKIFVNNALNKGYIPLNVKLEKSDKGILAKCICCVTTPEEAKEIGEKRYPIV